MYDSVDVLRAIRKLLTSNFTQKVMLTDIKTPETACFYVRYVTGKETQIATEYYSEKCSFEIVYFAENESDTELQIIKNKLQRLLRNPLIVYEYNDELGEEITSKRHYVEINNVSMNLNENDYVLTCLIDVELIDNVSDAEEVNRYGETENQYMMENLEIKVGEQNG